jgi:transcriptional regulator with XRE-family HTH domain
MISGFAAQFGQLVRAKREERDMSQEDLADAAELHRTHVSLIERGQRTVRIDTVAALARALRVQPGELMPKIKLPAK